jgi:choline dehydrogenase-like flavoprotein
MWLYLAAAAAAALVVAVGVVKKKRSRRPDLDRTVLAESYDYIVVGAGSAGAVVAARLAEELPNKTVLLLEAGPQDDLQEIHIPMAAFTAQVKDPEINWGYKTEPQSNTADRVHLWPRGRVLGGSSCLNFMLYVRGAAEDFDRWEKEFDCPGWGYRDVLPFFKKSENALVPGLRDDFHGKGGPLQVTRLQEAEMNPLSRAFLKGFEEVGVEYNDDYNGSKTRGSVRSQVSVGANGVRSSTAAAYLSASMLKERPNLSVATRMHVNKVIIENGRAVGVDASPAAKSPRQPGKVEIRANAEVVLCGGAVNSPQLLMLSGIGPRDHLEDVGIPVVVDSPGVGENLQDHLFCALAREVTRRNVTQDAWNIGVRDILRYLITGRGQLASQGVEVMAFTDSVLSDTRRNSPAPHVPDMQFHFFARGGSGPEDKPHDPAVNSMTLFGIPLRDERDFHDGCTVLPTLLYPKSRGTIRLKSGDPRAHPIIDPHYLEHPDDVELMIGGLELAERLLKTDAFAADLCKGGQFRTFLNPNDAGVTAEHAGDDRSPADRDAWRREHLRQFVLNVYHYSGTCKMGGEKVPDAVVDPHLRVNGIEGLRVADCSICPLIPGANTNAPAIMIGEKCAQLIVQDVTQ